jgi:hypothetical protein
MLKQGAFLKLSSIYFRSLSLGLYLKWINVRNEIFGKLFSYFRFANRRFEKNQAWRVSCITNLH